MGCRPRGPSAEASSPRRIQFSSLPLLFLFFGSTSSQSPGEVPTGVKEFQPGVSIDWTHKTVEVGAKVVLKGGSIELLACSARTKEHESILVVKPRPLHVMQAMGLVGLEPGSPTRFDAEKQQGTVPTGERLSLFVRFRDGDVEYTAPVEYWLREVKSGKSADPLPWVYSGSRNLGDGRFAADVDGTVAAVVDFSTSLISIGALHSADNEGLWLEANTEAIPPIGTDCTLLIRGEKISRKVVRLTLDVEGKPRLGELSLSMEQVLNRLKEPPADGSATSLEVDAGASAPAHIASFVRSLVESGIDRRRIEIRPQRITGPHRKAATVPED